jgi:hypothetical protein
MVLPELLPVQHLSPPAKVLALRLQLLSVAYRLALASQILSTVRDPAALPASADPLLPDLMPAVEGLALAERLPT